jgi:hypothetical protein
MAAVIPPAPVPPSVMEERFWRAAGPLITDDARSAVLLAGMPVCGIDGSLIAVADTKANRKAFGCADTKSQPSTSASPEQPPGLAGERGRGARTPGRVRNTGRAWAHHIQSRARESGSPAPAQDR